MKVLIIPEDPILDQYILRPLISRLFSDLGRPARIEVLSKPRLRGVAKALSPSVLAGISDTFRMVDLFLVLVDRDGDLERSAIAQAREAEHSALFVCLAIEEIEVWMLALHRNRLNVPWSEIRSETHPKERFAAPFLQTHAPRLDAGRGRAWAMRQGRWQGVFEVCPELQELRDRLRGWLEARS